MGNDLELLPNLPRRLRELRQGLGWSLDDVAAVTGVTQRGVASNWEAINQRRRTPPLSTLLILQRWYGVSLDYMVGHPDAERDSPAVKVGKRLLRERLRSVQGLEQTTPSERARMALTYAMALAPEAFFLERAVAHLLVDTGELLELVKGSGVWADGVIVNLAAFLGIPEEWFYVLEPAAVLLAVQ
jgi:transcriptional regulator with XRE-family HTH domain